jgi:RNA polymerase sigma-70 factor (ECF subfamily)
MVDDEKTLIRKCQRGAKEPFRFLVEKYKMKAYFFALSIVGNQEDALDLSQEAFIKAYRSIKFFKTNFKFKVWFFRILRNHCIDFLRKKKRQREYSLEEKKEQHGTEIVDPSPNPAMLLERNGLRQKLWEEINKLKGLEREIVIYKDLHGMSYEEIARILDIPKGTVASTLHKARRKLKDHLKRYLEA